MKKPAVCVAVALVSASLSAGGASAVRAAPTVGDRAAQPRGSAHATDWRTRFLSVAFTYLKSKKARPLEKAAIKHYGLPYGCAPGWIPMYFCPTQRPTYGIGYSVYASTPV